MNSSKVKEANQTLSFKDVELIQSFLQHSQHDHTLPFYSYNELCTLVNYINRSANLDHLLNFFQLLHNENIAMATPLLSNHQLTHLIKEITDISLVYLLFNCANVTTQDHILTSLQKTAPIRYRMLKSYQNDYLDATISETIKTLPYTNLNLISQHLFNSKLTKNELNFMSQELIKHHKKKNLLLYAHYCCKKMLHQHLSWKAKLDTILAIFYILDSLASKIDETKPIIKTCFTNSLDKIASLNDLNLLQLCLQLSPQLLNLFYDAILSAKQSSDFEKRRRYSTLLRRIERLSRTKNGGYLNVIFRQKHNSLN